MKKLILLCIVLLLVLAGCVAVPAPTGQPEPAAAGLQGDLSGDIRIGEDLDVVGNATIGDDATVAGDLTVSGTINGATNGGATLVLEGSTADDYETTLSPTDPTADNTVAIPNASGTIMLSSLATNAPDAANSVTGASNALVFEGSGVDAYETSLAAANPGADVTLTLPAETAAVMVSALTTNATDAANSVTGASNKLVFEGATADAYETSVAPTDPTADRTITLPDAPGTVMLSSLATNGADAANAVTGASNALVLEGATADAYETSITPTDPTADRTITLPNTSGTVGLISGSGMDTVIYGTTQVTGTATVTHGLTTPLVALCSMGTDPVDNEEDRCTVTISSTTVTVKVWKEAASPTAGDSAVTVYWMVAGTK